MPFPGEPSSPHYQCAALCWATRPQKYITRKEHLFSSLLQTGCCHTLASHLHLTNGGGHCAGPHVLKNIQQRRHLFSSLLQTGRGHTLASHLHLAAGVGHCAGPCVLKNIQQRRHLFSSLLQTGCGHTLASHLHLAAGVGHCTGPRLLQLGQLHAQPTAAHLSHRCAQVQLQYRVSTQKVKLFSRFFSREFLFFLQVHLEK